MSFSGIVSLGLSEAVGAVPDWSHVTALQRARDEKQAELNNITAKLSEKRGELVKAEVDLKVSKISTVFILFNESVGNYHVFCKRTI